MDERDSWSFPSKMTGTSFLPVPTTVPVETRTVKDEPEDGEHAVEDNSSTVTSAGEPMQEEPREERREAAASPNVYSELDAILHQDHLRRQQAGNQNPPFAAQAGLIQPGSPAARGVGPLFRMANGVPMDQIQHPPQAPALHPMLGAHHPGHHMQQMLPDHQRQAMMISMSQQAAGVNPHFFMRGAMGRVHDPNNHRAQLGPHGPNPFYGRAPPHGMPPGYTPRSTMPPPDVPQPSGPPPVIPSPAMPLSSRPQPSMPAPSGPSPNKSQPTMPPQQTLPMSVHPAPPTAASNTKVQPPQKAEGKKDDKKTKQDPNERKTRAVLAQMIQEKESDAVNLRRKIEVLSQELKEKEKKAQEQVDLLKKGIELRDQVINLNELEKKHLKAELEKEWNCKLETERKAKEEEVNKMEQIWKGHLDEEKKKTEQEKICVEKIKREKAEIAERESALRKEFERLKKIDETRLKKEKAAWEEQKEKDMKKLQEEKDERDATIKSLEKDQLMKVAAYESLKNEKSTSDGQIKKLEEDKKVKDAAFEKLEKEKSAVDEKVKELEADTKSLEDQVKELQEKTSDAAFKKLENEIISLNGKIEILGDEKKTSDDALAKEKKDHKEKADALVGEKRVLQEKFDKSEAEKKNLADSIAAIEEELEKKGRESAAKDEELRTQATVIEAKNKELADKSEKVDQLNEEKRVLQEKFEKSEKDNKKLQDDAQAASSEWMTKETELQNKIRKAEQDLIDQQREQSALKDQLTAYATDKDKLEKELVEVKSTLQTLEDDKKKLTEELVAARTQFGEIDSHLAALIRIRSGKDLDFTILPVSPNDPTHTTSAIQTDDKNNDGGTVLQVPDGPSTSDATVVPGRGRKRNATQEGNNLRAPRGPSQKRGRNGGNDDNQPSTSSGQGSLEADEEGESTQRITRHMTQEQHPNAN